MRKAYRLPLLLALLASLGLGAFGCVRPHWKPEFKDGLRDAISLKLLLSGVDMQYTDPIAQCVVDRVEKAIPDQARMERITRGEERDPIGGQTFRECACDIDPEARATPGFCK